MDKYPIPNVQDFTAHLHGCRVFSKLDLKKGYYQVKVADGDVCKTTVITPFGLWEFLRMPFGLRNAGQTFQRLMDQVLAGLDFVFVYLDDILIDVVFKYLPRKACCTKGLGARGMPPPTSPPPYALVWTCLHSTP